MNIKGNFVYAPENTEIFRLWRAKMEVKKSTQIG